MKNREEHRTVFFLANKFVGGLYDGNYLTNISEEPIDSRQVVVSLNNLIFQE